MVDELVASGKFDFGVVDEDIVEAARRNLVKVGGVLRFGIDEVAGGGMVIRVFPSRVAETIPGASNQSIGQRVEAYIVKANRAAIFHRRDPLDEQALVPCVVLVCSVWCALPGLNFGPPMTLSR